MFSIPKVLETILYNINLHEQLREVVIEECKCFEENRLDCLAEKNRDRVKLEKEIENTNNVIVTMFSKFNVVKNVDEKSVEEVKQLMDKLRDSIKYTMTIVEETVTNIKNKKDETFKQLKTLKKGKKAINSYAVYETI